MSKFFLRGAVAFAPAVCACASGGGVSGAAEPSAAVFDRIGSDALATKKVPGFSFAVLRDGKVVYLKGFGLADVERNATVAPNTRVAVGSITKQFTAAEILLLAQRGRLTLDDRLQKYVPNLPNASDITLRMLLNQTSGLHNYPVPGEHPWPWTGPTSLNTLLSFLATDKPDFSPGTQWEYSNANYAVAASCAFRQALPQILRSAPVMFVGTVVRTQNNSRTAMHLRVLKLPVHAPNYRRLAALGAPLTC